MRNLCGTIFYMTTNVLEDFHICIGVPLIELALRIFSLWNTNQLSDHVGDVNYHHILLRSWSKFQVHSMSET